MTTNSQKFKIGYHANTWDLAGHLDDCYADLSSVGFQWFEALVGDSLGSDFARRWMTLGDVHPPRSGWDHDLAVRLASMEDGMSECGVGISGLYFGAEFLNDGLWPAEQAMARLITRVLSGWGAEYLICGGGPPQRLIGSSEEEIDRFVHRLQTIGQIAQDAGVRAVYHPHLDTFVEAADEWDPFVSRLDLDYVGLCVDTAHTSLGGADPVKVLDDYWDAVEYVHLKDAKGPFNELRGYERYLSFTELGSGTVDIASVVDLLERRSYDGFAIVELDETPKPALESCQESADYLTEQLGVSL